MKGFSHEYENLKAPAAFYKDVPAPFLEATEEPAFTTHNVSFCFWHLLANDKWEYAVSPSDLNSDIFFLLQELPRDPNAYVEFCKDYYEETPDFEAVQSIYEHSPVTEKLAYSLNISMDYSKLAGELLDIGYTE